MRLIDKNLMQKILTTLRASKSFTGRFSFATINRIEPNSWSSRDMVGLPTKDGGSGVLLIELRNRLYSVFYEISPLRDRAAGLTKPIICDFCKTWQAGGRAGSITFRLKRRSLDSVSYLCCLDLNCSLHIRDMTEAARSSRAQLREDITQEYRIERFGNSLSRLIKRLSLEAIETTS